MFKCAEYGDDAMRTKIKFISSVIAMELAVLIAYVLLGVDRMDRSRSFTDQVGPWPIFVFIVAEFILMVVIGGIAEQIYDVYAARKSVTDDCLSVKAVQERILKKAYSKASDKLLWQLCSKNKKLTLDRLDLIAVGFSKDNADELVSMLKTYRVIENWASMQTEQLLFRNVCYKNGRLQLYFNDSALDTFLLFGDDEDKACD